MLPWSLSISNLNLRIRFPSNQLNVGKPFSPPAKYRPKASIIFFGPVHSVTRDTPELKTVVVVDLQWVAYSLTYIYTYTGVENIKIIFWSCNLLVLLVVGTGNGTSVVRQRSHN